MEEEEERSGRWTTILLIIGNIIIWGFIAIIFFSFNLLKANAATTSPADYWAYKDSNGNWSNGFSNETTQTNGSVTQINIGWNNQIGNINGVAYIEGRTTNKEISNLTTELWTEPIQTSTGIITKSCEITQYNILYYDFRCQISFSISNNTQQYVRLALKFKNTAIFESLSVRGYLTSESTNSATSDDIISQTSQIINNAVQNAVDIITNQNSAISGLIESQKVCINIDVTKNSTTTQGDEKGYLNYQGVVVNGNNSYVTSNYYLLKKDVTYHLTYNYATNYRYCFYDMNKDLINCYEKGTNTDITIIPNEDEYIRFTYLTSDTTAQTRLYGGYCTYGNQAITDSINQSINNSTNYFTQMIEKIDRIATAINPSRLWTDIPPDDSDFQTTHAMEEDILDMADDIDLDDVTIDLDTESSNWVWTTLTSLINTSSLVFSMFISILSIGIIKLLFNR